MELPGPLVSVDWLEANLDAVDVVDVRWAIDTGPQRDAYLEGHIAGAVFADLDADLSDPPGERGRHPLPSAEAFAEARQRLGLSGARPVVAYDARGGPVAARLWWMLDAIGVPTAVLDGGLAVWAGELESGAIDRPLAERPDPIAWRADRFIDADDIPQAIAAGAVLIDARSGARFRGEPNPIDDPAGHIPGGRSQPWDGNLTAEGTFAADDVLRQRFDANGIGDDTVMLASCGSGVTACHNLLAARLLGITDTRLYVGSWSEWSQSGRPVETDL